MVKSSSQIKYKTKSLAVEEDELQKTQKGYFQDMYNKDTKEQDEFNMYGFNDARGDNCFEGEPVQRAEVEVSEISKVVKQQVRMMLLER